MIHNHINKVVLCDGPSPPAKEEEIASREDSRIHDASDYANDIARGQ